MNLVDLFQIPVEDQVLFYAPLQRYVSLLSHAQADRLMQALTSDEADLGSDLLPLVHALRSREAETVQPRTGSLVQPLFLGLVTTRSCNLACRYCDFPTPVGASHHLTPDLAKASIDAFIELLERNGHRSGEVQFFGGEPFLIPGIVEFALPYARLRAEKRGIELKFEATTNGFFSRQRCLWIAENFDSVVLSLDGPEAIHNPNRPTRDGRGTFQAVFENAQILGRGNCELVIRMCVTHQSVEQLPEIGRWIGEQLPVKAICFEPLTASALSTKNGLQPPDPYRFAINFSLAADYLEQLGIDTVTSGVDIEQLQTSFCPVGKDAIIVMPDGKISACYLLEETWKEAGLELAFGWARMNPPRFEIHVDQLDRIRALGGGQYPLCSRCFCKYHCAGACHVNHRAIQRLQEYDEICIRTRLLTTRNLLRQIGALEAYQRWLSNLEAQRMAELRL